MAAVMWGFFKKCEKKTVPWLFAKKCFKLFLTRFLFLSTREKREEEAAVTTRHQKHRWSGVVTFFDPQSPGNISESLFYIIKINCSSLFLFSSWKFLSSVPYNKQLWTLTLSTPVGREPQSQT